MRIGQAVGAADEVAVGVLLIERASDRFDALALVVGSLVTHTRDDPQAVVEEPPIGAQDTPALIVSVSFFESVASF